MCTKVNRLLQKPTNKFISFPSSKNRVIQVIISKRVNFKDIITMTVQTTNPNFVKKPQMKQKDKHFRKTCLYDVIENVASISLKTQLKIEFFNIYCSIHR